MNKSCNISPADNGGKDRKRGDLLTCVHNQCMHDNKKRILASRLESVMTADLFFQGHRKGGQQIWVGMLAGKIVLASNWAVSAEERRVKCN